jgi:hypothetical protein
MSSLNKSDLIAIAERLQGTCVSIDEILNEDYGIDFTDLTTAQLEELDDRVLHCDVCGWWDDASEFNEDQICNECADCDG